MKYFYMYRFYSIIFFLCILFSIPGYAFYSPSYYIMPLGDSITRGYGESDESGMLYNSYRKPLYEAMQGEGYDIDFVGLQQDGLFEDQDHESFGGRTADDLAGNMYQWLESNPPDIILLHIGTNDITGHQSPAEIVGEVEEILDEIDRYHAEIMVLVAQIINVREDDGSDFYRDSTAEYNLLLADMVESRMNAGDKLVLVNAEAALDYSGGSSDFFDMRHPSEIGYQKIADTWYLPLIDVLDLTNLPPLEAGEVVVDHEWHRVDFERRYTDPVVVAISMSFSEEAPAVVRVQNVNATGFDIRIQNWDYLVDDHSSEQVGYLVMESGTYSLEDGTMISAGHVVTNHCADFDTVLFDTTFSKIPVVVSSVTTTNEEDAVAGRMQNISVYGFEYTMHEQELNAQVHDFETMSYIAWEPSHGMIHDIYFDVQRTQNNMTELFRPLNYSYTFPYVPVFISDIQTYNGYNPCTLRWENRGYDSILLSIQEEMSFDPEIEHDEESVGYIALASNQSTIDADNDGISDVDEKNIYGTDPTLQDSDDDGINDGDELAYWGELWDQDYDQDGLLQLLDPDSDNDGDPDGYEINNGYDPLDPDSVSQGYTAPVMEVGEIAIDDVWQRVELNTAFTDPVVVAGPLGLAEDQPATLRIRNVNATGFEIRIHEWSYLDSVHLPETINYMVMERGKYTLDNGIRIYAGRFTTLDSGEKQYIPFNQVFNDVPVVLTSITSVNESEPVIGRLSNVTSLGFEYGLQEEEQSDQGHIQESISYIAWEVSSGIVDNTAFCVGKTEASITDTFSSIAYARDFSISPGFIADIQSNFGTDPCNVRYKEKTEQSVSLQIDEEQSANDEVDHHTEVVGYIAFSRNAEDVDTDNDGINNEDESLYGTDPLYPDSDNDGIKDGDELELWGDAWDGDIDGDGLINLLDADADNDGDLDGYEVANGFDPGDPDSTSSSTSQLVVDMGEVSLTTEWLRVEFRHAFVHPVVIAGPLGFAEDEPAMVRIRNVNATGCELAVQEWEYEDQEHASESVGYFVMEEGKYILEDGTKVCSGYIDTNGGGLLHFDFNHIFDKVPVLFTSVTTYNDIVPVVGRPGNINKEGFEYILQEEESNDQIHESEIISYIAWEEFSGTVNGTLFTISKCSTDVSNTFHTISFDGSFVSIPVFLAGMQTYNGDNPANVRYRNKETTGVEVCIQEEQSLDDEVDHVGESVGYMVFPRNLVSDDWDEDDITNDDEVALYGTNATDPDTDGDGINDGVELVYWGTSWSQDLDNDGLINLLDPDSDGDGSLDGYEVTNAYDPADASSFPPNPENMIFETGEILIHSTWTRIPFQRSFNDPVVVAGPLGFADDQPVTLRIRNVNATGFDIRAQEWAYQDGIHLSELTNYLVMERGIYVLEDGTKICAGRMEAEGNESVQVAFSQTCQVVPVVFTSVTTENETDPVVGRIEDVTTQGFTYLLQEEEQSTQMHARETFSYVAWEPFSGITNNVAIEVGRTAKIMDHTFKSLAFTRPFVGVPLFLGEMQTANGNNPCTLRWQNKTVLGVELQIDEEQSQDDEVEHTAEESVGFIAFSFTLADVDSDQDGIDNDAEEKLYGTDPEDADTDNDELQDGEELEYWGAMWNLDSDGDGLVNLLDPDSDNDGDLDGYEILHGTDPSDPASVSPSTSDIIFESGEVALDVAWKHVVFTLPYVDPVIVAGPLGLEDEQPATIRIRNLNATGCDIRIQEWDYLDGEHATEIVGYMVMERGKYTLSDGTRVCAESIEATGGGEQLFTFNQVFSESPFVFTSVVTENDSTAVVGRLDTVSADGFTYYLQEEEQNDQVHAAETVSYIAWEAFYGTVNGYYVVIGRVNEAITHTLQEAAFGHTFLTPPVVMASMQTASGGNPANLRYTAKGESSAMLKIAEEQSLDAEMDHYEEETAYLLCTHASSFVDQDDDGLTDDDELNVYGTNPGDADSDNDGINDAQELEYWGVMWDQDLDEDGLINILDTDSDNDGDPDGYEIADGYDPGDASSTEPSVLKMVFEIGRISVGSEWMHVGFDRAYTSPVVVCGPLGSVEDQPATLRIRDLTPTGFDLRVQEWESEDGIHAEESVSYLVMEQGEYVLQDGSMIQAGIATLPQDGGTGEITFPSLFSQIPVVMGSIVSENDTSAVINRLSGITSQGFSCTMQEEEAADQVHAGETLTYIAWEPSSGVVNRIHFSVVQASFEITSSYSHIDFAADFGDFPVFLADMQTFNGNNPGNIRYRDCSGTGVDVHVDEEQSLDSEVTHYGEGCGYFVLSQ